MDQEIIFFCNASSKSFYSIGPIDILPGIDTVFFFMMLYGNRHTSSGPSERYQEALQMLMAACNFQNMCRNP